MKMASDDRPDLPDVLAQEARVWLRRLTSGDATEWDAQAFRRWKQSSPAHQQAFKDAKRQWQAMGPAIGKLLHSNRDVAAMHERSMRSGQPAQGRRMFLRVATGGAAAAIGAAIVHPPLQLWPSLSEWQADVRTDKGEQRSLALNDRVNLTLNTQTSVRKEILNGEIGGIDLITGEAAIDLRGDTSFNVVAGVGRSTAREGRFEVRNLDGKVCVTCVQGAVRVEHPGGVLDLKPRQQAIYDANVLGRAVAVETANMSAWRKGELVFRQTPLEQVIEEINRYRPGRVVLAASSVRESAVSGRFSIAALDSALLQLQHSFDLNARRLPGGVLVLS
ncbi:FecR family protein [Herbaspirillum chlorophenolicum]|uniref:FecR family protein n=1 Tax=Herbaspirillum chlorophenolicum TaxID=211589 RepID=UPI00067C8EB0|nr:FecR domain-containing protein [Herbaspirillum chlorophenolicum]